MDIIDDLLLMMDKKYKREDDFPLIDDMSDVTYIFIIKNTDRVIHDIMMGIQLWVNDQIPLYTVDIGEHLECLR